MISVLINALILIALMWLVARHEADLEMYKAVFAVLLISTLTWGFPMMTIHILGIFSFFLAPIAAVFILRGLCWLPLPKAILVTVLYFSLWAGFALLTGKFQQDAYGGDGWDSMTPVREAAEPVSFPEPAEEDSEGFFGRLADTVTGWFGKGSDEKGGSGLPGLFSSRGAEYAGADAAHWAESQDAIRISGTGFAGEGTITLFVNGTVMSDGDILEVPLNGKIYQWKLRIEPDQTYTWIPVYEGRE